MGSRYGGDPRYSEGALPYRDAPSRWDRETFVRERDERYRGPAVPERERAYEGYRSPPRREAEVVERRYVEEDRYGPRGSRVEKKYFEEEDYYTDPRAARGALVPFRERPEPPPPRPGLLRRQSSLDTFDRQPARRYNDYDDRRIPVPLPPPDSQRYARPRYEERIYYDDVKVQEPEERYREVREREWITQRRRGSSHSRERPRSIADQSVREEVREEEVIEEKPFPRRGKTRMPRRIVRIEVLYDIGYPFREEGDMIIIEKALSKELIDEVIERSRAFREVEEVKTVHTIETPEIRETKVTEEIRTLPLEEAPRSVREWDALSVRSDAKSRQSHRSHSTHSRHTRKTSHSRRSRSKSSSSSSRSGFEIEKKSTIIERRPSRGETEVIERRKTIIEEDGIDESSSVHVGPLALVVDRRKSRSDREIREEIRRLERERRSLREERRDRDIVKVERLRERSPSRNRAIIIEERGDEVVEVRKDKRGPPPPSPGIIKAMMATLT